LARFLRWASPQNGQRDADSGFHIRADSLHPTSWAGSRNRRSEVLLHISGNATTQELAANRSHLLGIKSFIPPLRTSRSDREARSWV
jgi:hypothetical protein